MREIKFRAWGSHDVEYNWDTEDEFGKPIATYSDPSMIYFGIVNGLDEMHHNPSGLKIMQYTGLKDKNGVEIYEGDIVTCDCWIDKNDFIVFECGSFILANYTGDEGELQFISNYKMEDESLYLDLEVVGNIYENKELLDGKM